MAKQVQLRQNGVDIYPQTITQAIADTTKGQLLSQVLTGIEGEALSWNIKTISGNTTGYTYGLYYTPSGGSETLKSEFSIAQDIYLDSVTFVASSQDVPSGHTAPGTDFPYLLMVFNSESGKNDVWVPLKGLVDVYTADGQGITVSNNQFSLVLDPNNYNIITKSNSGLYAKIEHGGDPSSVGLIRTSVTSGTTAVRNKISVTSTKKLVDAVASAETAIQSVNDSSEYLSVLTNTKKEVIIGLGVATDLATDTLTNKVADAAAAKAYTDNKVNALNASESNQNEPVIVTVSQASGLVDSVSVAVSTTAMENVTESTPATDLATAKDVKDYVNTQVGAGNVVDSIDIDSHQTSTGTTLSINFANSGNTDTTEGVTNAVFNTTQGLAVNGKQVYAWAVTAEDKGDVTVVWPE